MDIREYLNNVCDASERKEKAGVYVGEIVKGRKLSRKEGVGNLFTIEVATADFSLFDITEGVRVFVALADKPHDDRWLGRNINSEAQGGK